MNEPAQGGAKVKVFLFELPILVDFLKALDGTLAIKISNIPKDAVLVKVQVIKGGTLALWLRSESFLVVPINGNAPTTSPEIEVLKALLPAVEDPPVPKIIAP